MLSGCDESRPDISLSEAWELAPFPICTPTYLPENISATPEVVYHADFRDPLESDVRLRYFDKDSHELAFEIYQRYSPGTGTGEEIIMDYPVGNYYERELLRWQGILVWSKGKEQYTTPEDQILIVMAQYDDVDMKRWMFQIKEPTHIKANLIIWGNDPVWYQVYTHLPVQDAQEIVRSMPNPGNCSPP